MNGKYSINTFITIQKALVITGITLAIFYLAQLGNVYQNYAAADETRTAKCGHICDPLGAIIIGEKTATILANTYDALGEQTPVEVWLAAAFRKKMALFREDYLADTLSV